MATRPPIRPVFLILAIVTITLAAVSCADEPPPGGPDLSAPVEALITQLADDDPRVRNDAERQLEALGYRLLPFLPDSTAKLPEDLKLRIARIRQRLEQREAEAATRPSRVTLRGEFTLAEVLRTIESQTGNRLRDGRGHAAEPTRITLNLHEAPFWQATESLLRATSTRLVADPDEPKTLVLSTRPSGSKEIERGAPLASLDGLVRAELFRAARIQDWRSDPRDRLRLDVDLIWEPRLAPLELRLVKDDLAAEDDQGNALQAIDATPTQWITERRGSIQMAWIFAAPAPSARHLRSTTATITALLPGTAAVFTFEKLPDVSNSSRQHGGVTVTLKEVRRQDGLHEIHILVEYDHDSPALESHRGWIYRNPAYLRKKDGTLVENSGMEMWRQQGRQIGLTYRFEVPDLHGTTFVYQTPMAFLSAPMRVQFHNIPLP